jgi:flagellin-like protein
MINGTQIMFNNNRSQVGIGTLIVFIAMVLVAAIAAGVLLNTSQMLQAQAELTGEESTAQVSNNIEIQTVYGNVSNSGTINEVNVTVSVQPGSDRINFTATTIEFLSDDLYNLDARNGNVTYNSIQGSDETSLQSGEHLGVLIPTDGAGSNPNPLRPGDTAEITVITEYGSQVTKMAYVPSTMRASDGAIRL